MVFLREDVAGDAVLIDYNHRGMRHRLVVTLVEDLISPKRCSLRIQENLETDVIMSDKRADCVRIVAGNRPKRNVGRLELSVV